MNQHQISATDEVRQAELMIALSAATDLGMGQPLEFAMQSCQAAMRLADFLGFPEADRRIVYFQSLLRYIGCNIETHLLASVFGDELALRKDIIHAETGNLEFLRQAVRAIQAANPAAPPLQMLQVISRGMIEANRFSKEFYAGHCEVAERLAERLSFEPMVVNAIKQVYARWDGKGIPALKGETIAPGMLVVSLAKDAVYAHRLGGVAMAVDLARQRKGSLYAPQHVEVFCQYANEILAETGENWQAVLALEPGQPKILTEEELDRACEAIANFTDMKSPFLLGHSPGVARVAATAARRFGLPPGEVTDLRRAALLQGRRCARLCEQHAGLYGTGESHEWGFGFCDGGLRRGRQAYPHGSGCGEPADEYRCFGLYDCRSGISVIGSMDRIVEFSSEGATPRGRLNLPEGTAGPFPAVIMAHGFSATINGMMADQYAETFCKAGFAVLLYDHRNFGISGGEPRQQINKWIQGRRYYRC